jgi:hypothetical protein
LHEQAKKTISVIDSDDEDTSTPFEPYANVNFALGSVKIIVHKGERLSLKGVLGGSSVPSPYLRIICGDDKKKSNTVKNSENPTFEEEYEFVAKVGSSNNHCVCVCVCVCVCEIVLFISLFILITEPNESSVRCQARFDSGQGWKDWIHCCLVA